MNGALTLGNKPQSTFYVLLELMGITAVETSGTPRISMSRGSMDDVSVRIHEDFNDSKVLHYGCRILLRRKLLSSY